MIHGLEYMGLIDAIATGISDTISQASEKNRLMVAVLLLWVSAIASAFIDNIPHTATMVPVVIELASDPELNQYQDRWHGHWLLGLVWEARGP